MDGWTDGQTDKHSPANAVLNYAKKGNVWSLQ